MFITMKQIIPLKQARSFFRKFCQKFSFMVLRSFCLIFCKFQPGVAYESAAYKKAYNFQEQKKSLLLYNFLTMFGILRSFYLLVQSQSWEHLNNLWNLFKVNKKNIRMTLIAVLVVNFEQAS